MVRGKKLFQLANAGCELVSPGFRAFESASIRKCYMRDGFKVEGVIEKDAAVQGQVLDQEMHEATVNVVFDCRIEEWRDADNERLRLGTFKCGLGDCQPGSHHQQQ